MVSPVIRQATATYPQLSKGYTEVFSVCEFRNVEEARQASTTGNDRGTRAASGSSGKTLQEVQMCPTVKRTGRSHAVVSENARPKYD
ncbi:hypothetical protein TNCT_192241 [Trichonephila clavata]|uniref:Uncharacterized protein n=1 Tax=Trichonephila clavata TaxID=2740835 RepID=A0A8X6L2X6_TRICU|nr:hypothetical protein TNCT_192241 [Trichonephila clavata]